MELTTHGPEEHASVAKMSFWRAALAVFLGAYGCIAVAANVIGWALGLSDLHPGLYSFGIAMGLLSVATAVQVWRASAASPYWFAIWMALAIAAPVAMALQIPDAQLRLLLAPSLFLAAIGALGFRALRRASRTRATGDPL